MREEFISALKANQAAFGVNLADEKIGRMADFYDVVGRNNELLHLVAPTTAEEFAGRHILESLTLLPLLRRNAKFADVGTGAGLPSIPCLLARDDLSAILIESKEKKAKYLIEACESLGLSERARVVNRQFEEADIDGTSAVTCRALDKFTEKLPRMIKWAKGRRLLLFGGNNLREALEKQKAGYTEKLMPMSEQRYLFALNK